MSRDGSRIAETEESERSRHSDAGGLDHGPRTSPGPRELRLVSIVHSVSPGLSCVMNKSSFGAGLILLYLSATP